MRQGIQPPLRAVQHPPRRPLRRGDGPLPGRLDVRRGDVRGRAPVRSSRRVLPAGRRLRKWVQLHQWRTICGASGTPRRSIPPGGLCGYGDICAYGYSCINGVCGASGTHRRSIPPGVLCGYGNICACGLDCINGVCGTPASRRNIPRGRFCQSGDVCRWLRLYQWGMIPSGGLCRSDDVCAAGLACINVATAAPPDASPYFPGVIERIVASAQVGLSATRAPSTASIAGGAP